MSGAKVIPLRRPAEEPPTPKQVAYKELRFIVYNQLRDGPKLPLDETKALLVRAETLLHGLESDVGTESPESYEAGSLGWLRYTRNLRVLRSELDHSFTVWDMRTLNQPPPLAVVLPFPKKRRRRKAVPRG